MVVALSHTNIYPGFSTGNKVHKYYLVYGLWVQLGWILLDETNLEWKAEYKVVLNYKLKHTNKELGKWLTWGRRTPEGFRRGWSAGLVRDRPRRLSAPPGSVLLQCTYACFVASWPRAPRGCTFQTFSSTPLLALLLLPLDDFALSHLHASSPHMPPWYSCKTRPWLPPMLVLCMWFDKRCWRGIPWCIMVHARLG
jgi:hypothetical protein